MSTVIKEADASLTIQRVHMTQLPARCNSLLCWIERHDARRFNMIWFNTANVIRCSANECDAMMQRKHVRAVFTWFLFLLLLLSRENSIKTTTSTKTCCFFSLICVCYSEPQLSHLHSDLKKCITTGSVTNKKKIKFDKRWSNSKSLKTLNLSLHCKKEGV